MTTRPGTWQRVETTAGWHLRLVGANGETVLTSEVYTRPETAAEALETVARTFNPGTTYAGAGGSNTILPALVDVDETASNPESASTETDT